jgi:hypothetical protein
MEQDVTGSRPEKACSKLEELKEIQCNRCSGNKGNLPTRIILLYF